MKVEVFGKNGFTPSDANKEYCLKKLEKLEGYFPDNESVDAKVVCKVYKQHHKIEITIPTKNLILRAEVGDDDLYAAVDKAVDKLLVQVRKHKDKTKNKFDKDGIKTVHKETVDNEVNHKENNSSLVRTKQVDLVPMSQEDAIHQMELLDHNFFVYLDEITMKVNVLYVRNDSGYAVIETK
ncbi:MAG: ribosome-associated translation inhibitor RaiA [bacterium]